MTGTPSPLRSLALMIAAAGVGIAIAVLDSRPGYDATGVTVGLLVIAAAGFSAAERTRPWLWALLVGIWIPLLEIPSGGGLAPVAALAIAAAGALAGYTGRRLADAR